MSGAQKAGTFFASRPEVLPLLVEVRVCHWGWLAEFHGTQAELIAAGLAQPSMFELGKSAQRTTLSEFGDRLTIKRQRGKWTLDMKIGEAVYWPSDATLDPASKGYEKRLDRKRWLAQGGAEAEAATAAILSRFARPAVRP